MSPVWSQPSGSRVAAVAAEAFTDQEEFATALWPDNPEGRTMPAQIQGPLYCFVPLHPAAVDYYEDEEHGKTLPDCSNG